MEEKITIQRKVNETEKKVEIFRQREEWIETEKGERKRARGRINI